MQDKVQDKLLATICLHYSFRILWHLIAIVGPHLIIYRACARCCRRQSLCQKHRSQSLFRNRQSSLLLLLFRGYRTCQAGEVMDMRSCCMTRTPEREVTASLFLLARGRPGTHAPLEDTVSLYPAESSLRRLNAACSSPCLLQHNQGMHAGFLFLSPSLHYHLTGTPGCRNPL